MVPIAPSWVISKKLPHVCPARPGSAHKRFDIEIVTDATPEDLAAASGGTLQDGDLVYKLDGETYRTSIKTIRGDYDFPMARSANRLRRWDKADIVPRPDDIFQERLYCIQWITKDTLDSFRPKFYFAAPTEADFQRERKVEETVRENLADWQNEGLVPDLPIEPGEKTRRTDLEPADGPGGIICSTRGISLIGALFESSMQALKEPDRFRSASRSGSARHLIECRSSPIGESGSRGSGGVAPAAR